MVAFAAGGCHMPWSPGEVSGWETAATAPDRTASADTAAPATTAPAAGATSATAKPADAANVAGRPADIRLGSASTSGDDASMASVLDVLQRVGEVDPAAQQTLLKELRDTKPSLRPLVAQQFNAALAYHQQLAAEPAAKFGADGVRDASRSSETIGSLVDPRGLRGNPAYEQALARATPAAIPVPGIDEAGAQPLAPPDVPPAFTADLPTGALAVPPEGMGLPVQNATNPSARAPAATTPVSYETAGDGTGRVEPAVLRTPVTGSTPYDNSPHPGPLPGGEGARHPHPGLLPGGEGECDWRELIERAVDDLQERVAESPQSTAEVHQHVSLRILQLLAGNTEEALRPIPHISSTEQQYWSAQLFALATYLDHHAQPDDKRRAAATAVHLDEALTNLREVGSLSLRNLTFCQAVYDFGAYEPCDGTTFSPGQQLTLYAEVENYRSQSTEKGYTTTLGTSYKILNERDELVDSGQFPDVEDCCRSRRRDFHIQYGLALPTTIAPGEYRLELVVKDRLSDKLGHGTIPLKIAGTRR